MPLLDIRNLTIEIDTPQGKVKAVDRVSLTLNEGEIRGLVGESGSGKSLVAKVIVGIQKDNWTVRADRPQSFHIEGVMFQIRNVNGSSPFPEDRGWKDTVWVDGQVELLVYYAQPSWPHFPFQYLSQTLELADRGSIGQMLVNPAP